MQSLLVGELECTSLVMNKQGSTVCHSTTNIYQYICTKNNTLTVL